MSQKIYTLIPKVMSDVGAIGKDRRNQHQNYSFRGIEDMYNEIQPMLVKHGVFCVPQVIDRVSEQFTSKNGSVSFRVLLTVNHKFYADDGSFVEVITTGEGIDTSDKASNKAMSAAMKYAFIELLSIPTQDIEDGDRTTPEGPATPQAPRASQSGFGGRQAQAPRPAQSAQPAQPSQAAQNQHPQWSE